MKCAVNKRIRVSVFCLFMIISACFWNQVLAANWVSVESADYLIDSETVVREGNLMYYWEYLHKDDGGAKTLIQYCIKLDGNLRGNIVQGYLYDPKNRLRNEIVGPHTHSVVPGSAWERGVLLAMAYAKERKHSQEIPALP